MVNIGLLGYGFCGANILNKFNLVEDAKVTSICDINPYSLDRAGRASPGISTTTDYRDLIRSSSIDAVAIATPVSTHYELAREALLNGRHIFVSKPLTETVDQGKELIELAEKNGLWIMVDHTYLFSGAVKRIKDLIESDVLGNILYYDSTRVNLGVARRDVNAVWDLAPHDLAIMDYIVPEEPEAVTANGMPYQQESLAHIAYITVYFGDNMIAHFNANSLSPVKVQTTLIGGDKRMLVWNDLDGDEKVKVYDKGIKVHTDEGMRKLLVSSRTGDMWSPKIDHADALKSEAEYFVSCVTDNRKPFNDGLAGLRIVKMLVASDESLKDNGRMISLS